MPPLSLTRSLFQNKTKNADVMELGSTYKNGLEYEGLKVQFGVKKGFYLSFPAHNLCKDDLSEILIQVCTFRL